MFQIFEGVNETTAGRGEGECYYLSMPIPMNMLMLTGAAYFDTSSKVLVSFLFNILHTVPKVVILVQLLNKNYLMLNSILSRCTDYYKKKKP